MVQVMFGSQSSFAEFGWKSKHIIHVPSSTKNETKERDPEMHQTKKGNQWYLGAKAHVGVNSK